MIRVVAITVFLAATLFAESAFPCGGGFGEQLEVNSSQTIIVRYGDGQETYIFNPHFCGASTDFGLILPVPGILTEEPALAQPAIYDALDEISAPEIIVEEVCNDSRSQNDFSGGDGLGYGDTAAGGGVDVLDSGQVGIFDWELIRADAAEAFTDWLDANQYPYNQAAAQHFAHYVEQSWYFIAFKVTAGSKAPPEGTLLCGTFGPIRIAFSTDSPVIPARIAAVGEGEYNTFYWRLHLFADSPQTASNTVDWEDLRYTGTVTEAQLADFPAIFAAAKKGDLFTSLDVQFFGGEVDEDIALVSSDGPTEYRKTIYQTKYVDCLHKKDSGCSVATPGGSSDWLLLSLAIAAFVLWRRKWFVRLRQGFGG